MKQYYHSREETAIPPEFLLLGITVISFMVIHLTRGGAAEVQSNMQMTASVEAGENLVWLCRMKRPRFTRCETAVTLSENPSKAPAHLWNTLIYKHFIIKMFDLLALVPIYLEGG